MYKKNKKNLPNRIKFIFLQGFFAFLNLELTAF
jgi:hypothetical protein